MPGTKQGGISAAKTNKKRHGSDFYKNIGKLGGQKSRGGGFASDFVDENGLTGAERASIYGKIGGKKSRSNKKPSDSQSKHLHSIVSN